MQITHMVGDVSEARQLTESRVSGGGKNSAVSTSVKHFTNCRINWQGGKVSFEKMSVDASVGDRVGVVYGDGKRKGEFNVTTGEFKHTGFSPNAVDWLLFVAEFFLLFMFGIGLLLFVGHIVWLIGRSKSEARELRGHVSDSGYALA